MKSKKFVLVGFVLLAITMVLLPLSGCKTEVDTSSPQQEQTDDSTGNNGSTDTGSDSNEDNKPKEHQVDVEATAPVNPAEGKITKSDSGYTFTADFGDNASGAYAWFVDGERQECTDKEFTWDTSSVAAGVHEIRVEFGDNDAQTTVEVKK
ncbi:MAG: hypothetical protein IJW57_09205 [Spirochaetaceae bacterium]|nr:hypothetical protein [Spirochaetaceae bacterium]